MEKTRLNNGPKQKLETVKMYWKWIVAAVLVGPFDRIRKRDDWMVNWVLCVAKDMKFVESSMSPLQRVCVCVCVKWIQFSSIVNSDEWTVNTKTSWNYQNLAKTFVCEATAFMRNELHGTRHTLSPFSHSTDNANMSNIRSRTLFSVQILMAIGHQ